MEKCEKAWGNICNSQTDKYIRNTLLKLLFKKTQHWTPLSTGYTLQQEIPTFNSKKDKAVIHLPDHKHHRFSASSAI